MPIDPLNELAMLADYIDPDIRVVAHPNQDVVYGFGIFALEQEPVVVQVPDFGERFWMYQICDQRTDSFASFGSPGRSQGNLFGFGGDTRPAPVKGAGNPRVVFDRRARGHATRNRRCRASGLGAGRAR